MAQSAVPGLAFSAATSRLETAGGWTVGLAAGEQAVAKTEISTAVLTVKVLAGTVLARKVRGANRRRRIEPVVPPNTRTAPPPLCPRHDKLPEPFCELHCYPMRTFVVMN
jgi:hypothetical protein